MLANLANAAPDVRACTGDASPWEGDSWKNRLGVNAWPFYFTLDEQRGLLFVPLASPIGGSYNGDRKGANLFGNSVVALDVQTGAYKWHVQTIYHDLWDADPPAPPALFDIRQNDRTIPALGVTTKSGYLYILNRETGQTIFGVEEPPVPKSDVPGELAFPTQPFPVKPPPLARVTYAPADLVTAADTTPEHARACAELVAKIAGVHNAGPFTPWRYRGDGGAQPAPSLVFPGGLGAANWGGIASDLNSGYLFVVTLDVGTLGWIEKAKEGSPQPYQKATPGRSTFDVPMGDLAWPCQKPPWARLTAVNASTADITRQVPLGRHRSAASRPTEHGASGSRGGDRDRQRPALHRVATPTRSRTRARGNSTWRSSPRTGWSPTRSRERPSPGQPHRIPAPIVRPT